MIPAVDLRTEFEHALHGMSVVRRNRGEEFLGRPDICLLAPFTDVDWVEAARDALTPRVFLDEPIQGDKDE